MGCPDSDPLWNVPCWVCLRITCHAAMLMLLTGAFSEWSNNVFITLCLWFASKHPPPPPPWKNVSEISYMHGGTANLAIQIVLWSQMLLWERRNHQDWAELGCFLQGSSHLRPCPLCWFSNRRTGRSNEIHMEAIGDHWRHKYSREVIWEPFWIQIWALILASTLSGSRSWLSHWVYCIQEFCVDSEKLSTHYILRLHNT